MTYKATKTDRAALQRPLVKGNSPQADILPVRTEDLCLN
jgi:hypothetical protein